MEKSFSDLVERVMNSFLVNKVSVREIQSSIKHIPVTLKLQLGDIFERRVLNLLETKQIEELFHQLSFSWDYLNPGLLHFLVDEFGSPDDKISMTSYLKKLNKFQASVKIGDFINAKHTETSSHLSYYKIITIMNNGWEDKTLQDVENFKIELCNRSHLPQSFLTKTSIEKSSIAIVFYLPNKIEIDIDEMKPFFENNSAPNLKLLPQIPKKVLAIANR